MVRIQIGDDQTDPILILIKVRFGHHLPEEFGNGDQDDEVSSDSDFSARNVDFLGVGMVLAIVVHEADEVLSVLVFFVLLHCCRLLNLKLTQIKIP